MLLFYTFAAIAIVASLLVIGQRNPIYSVLLLIASFGALSGLYVLMLLNAPHEETDYDVRVHPLLRAAPLRFGVVLALGLIGELGWALTKGRELGAFPGGSVSSV